MNLYRIDYRAGWHSETMPLISWCFVVANDPTQAQNRLHQVKKVHPDDIIKIEPQPFVPEGKD